MTNIRILNYYLLIWEKWYDFNLQQLKFSAYAKQLLLKYENDCDTAALYRGSKVSEGTDDN